MATVNVRVDNAFTLHVNGKQAFSGSSWSRLYAFDLDLSAGDVIAIDAVDTGGAAEAFVDIRFDDGQRYGSGTDWVVANGVPGSGWALPGFDDSGWVPATSYGTAETGRLAGTGDAMPADAPGKWIWSTEHYRDNEVFLRWTVPGATGPNVAPVVGTAIPDQTVPTGQAFAIPVPAGTFLDADGDALTLSATLPSGAALPGWLSFDASRGTFSGTPQNLGSITVRVTADDANGGSVSDAFSITSFAATGALSFAGQSLAKSIDLQAGRWADAARVMPLGDSITNGYDLDGGYRLPLWQDLVDERGLWIDYVGQYTANPAPFLLDTDHQGRVGITAQAVLANIDAITAATPHDISLILLGTNEVLRQTNPAATVPGRLLDIMRAIEDHNPDARILLGTLPFLDNPADRAEVQAINAALPSVVATARSEGIAATLVSHSNITRADLYDGIHPNAAGAEKMADNWLQAMLAETSRTAGTLDGVAHSAAGVRSVTGSETGDLILGSQAADTLSGGGGNDRLAGRAGNDTLNGDVGNDVIVGGAGNDVIRGHGGGDTFVFDASHAGSDRAIGFTTTDTVLLTGFEYADRSDAAADFARVGSDVVFSNAGLTVTFANEQLADVKGAVVLGEPDALV
jgi:lysophospholipase L1-like esterase